MKCGARNAPGSARTITFTRTDLNSYFSVWLSAPDPSREPKDSSRSNPESSWLASGSQPRDAVKQKPRPKPGLKFGRNVAILPRGQGQAGRTNSSTSSGVFQSIGDVGVGFKQILSIHVRDETLGIHRPRLSELQPPLPCGAYSFCTNRQSKAYQKRGKRVSQIETKPSSRSLSISVQKKIRAG